MSKIKIDFKDPSDQRVNWGEISDGINWNDAFEEFKRLQAETNDPNSRKNKLLHLENMTNDELAEKFIDFFTKKPENEVSTDGMRIKADDY